MIGAACEHTGEAIFTEGMPTLKHHGGTLVISVSGLANRARRELHCGGKKGGSSKRQGGGEAKCLCELGRAAFGGRRIDGGEEERGKKKGKRHSHGSLQAGGELGLAKTGSVGNMQKNKK